MKYTSYRVLDLRLALVACSTVVLASACGASNLQQTSLHRAGPAGMTQAPPLTRTPYAMAYGRAGAARANAARPNVNIDEYLLAEASNPRAPRPRRAALPPAQPVAATPVQAQAVLASATELPLSSESEQLAAATPPAAPQGFERYSERAQNSRDLLKFAGGDAVVITASTLVVILLIVLLLILLT